MVTAPTRLDAEWTHEYDVLAWCEPCHNYRSAVHVSQHAACVKDHKPWPRGKHGSRLV
jgi:hypothetical protein